MPEATVPIRISRMLYEEIIKWVSEGKAHTQAEALDKMFLDLKSTVVVQAAKLEKAEKEVTEKDKEITHWKAKVIE